MCCQLDFDTFAGSAEEAGPANRSSPVGSLTTTDFISIAAMQWGPNTFADPTLSMSPCCINSWPWIWTGDG